MIHTFSKRQSAALLLIPMLALAGCKRKETVKVEQTDEEGPRLASTVHTGDPKSDTQLVNGFYAIEQNAWRWTAQRFSVVLRPPAGGAQRGATLNLQLTVPDATIAKLKTIALTATIGGVMLPPETYTQPGQYTYTRDVAPNLLTSEAVRIDFQTDKSLPPGTADARELGVIVAAVGLDAK
ncbi:MAG: hypothetical protein C5B51_17980 [Terriglobia bacterium]|nr:MAG: hypothetical protein C5B51_17980 [Terriglobia bacterium]